MLPAAALVHQVPGRVRVRVEECRRDAAYFARVAEQLRQCPSVLDVTATPATGSILILHEGTDLDVIVGYARALDLFELAPPAGRAAEDPLPDQIIRERLHHVDRWIRRESDDHADLRSLALIGLLAGAVWQVVRGQVLPAGATLLWYALALTREPRPPAAPRVDEPGTGSGLRHARQDGVREE